MIKGQKGPKNKKPHPFRVPPGHTGFMSLYDLYKRNASRQGRAFDLSVDDFKKLTSSNCYYCGVEPSQVKIQKSSTMLPASIERGKYVYTGLDRVDNSLGYVAGNVRPCCRTCNFAKASMPEEKFLSWVDRLVKFQIKKAA